MKRIFHGFLILFIFIICSGLQAALPPDMQSRVDGFARQKAMNIAYSVVVPGGISSSGTAFASKVYNIVRLEAGKYLPNTIIVKTKKLHNLDNDDKGFYSQGLMSSLQDLGIEKIRAPFKQYSESNSMLAADEYGIGRIYELTYASPVDPYDVCRDLIKNPDVEYAVPVFMRYVSDYNPNDPRYTQNQQWYLAKIGMPKAWEISKGSKDVLIGIVDSGTDWQHEDLAANIWTNPKEIDGNGIDDDGNGYIDDVRGWDFVGNVTQNEAWSYTFKPDNNPKNTGSSSDNTHGTHVAGCASAVTDNKTGIAGTAFNCSLLPVKCGSDNSGIRGIYRGYEGIFYAANMGCQIINCSWGGPGSSPAEQDVINQVTAMGALVVVAAGNDNGLNIDEGGQYPACYDNVLCVGATNSSDKVAGFSNIGNLVSVYTPGQGIMSTITGNNYQNADGTSMASPITAGIAALVKSVHKNWTPMQILHQLRSTCDNVLTSDTTLRPIFYGRTNCYKALSYNNPINPSQNIGGVEMTGLVIEGGATLTDYNPRKVTFELKNYLNPVLNLKVKITPLHNYISVDKTDEMLGLLNMNQTKTIDLKVRLLENNPWFEGNAYILLTYEGEGYKDYQVIQIPIETPSENTWTLAYQFQDALSVQMTSSSTDSYNGFWTVGTSMYGGLFYHTSNSGTKANVISQSPIYSLYALDENKAVAGTGPSNGNAEILYTINGGANWLSSNVAGITNFVNCIHFFDANQGIFTGDPVNSKWGVGYTTDGGKSWKQVAGMEPPLPSETAFLNSGCWLADNGWFGTRKGKIFRSTDRGMTWASSTLFSSGEIFQMVFKDPMNGMAVYAESGAAAATKYLAVSSDGGASWQPRKYNFTANVLTPASFYLPPKSDMIICIFTGGQVYSTTDMGASWQPILSKKTVGAHSGAGFAEGTKLKIWTSASKVAFLETKYMPLGAKSILNINGALSLKFDSVEVNKSKSLNLEIASQGDLDVANLSGVFVPDAGVEADEFKFLFPLPATLASGESKTLRIKFSPKAEGIRRAVLKITSNAETAEYNIQLEGTGYKVVSAEESGELQLKPEISINPNPVHGDFLVSIKTLQPGNIELSLCDLLGNPVAPARRFFSDGFGEFPVEVADLPAGIYFLNLKIEAKIYIEKIVKTN